MKRLTAALVTLLFGTATPASAVQDGLWYLAGSDYVTIEAIDLPDPNPSEGIVTVLLKMIIR
ncbi:MAG: hypothetical protein EOM90_13655 [Alphaproteobacteria bacterium]|nr:hypothetical protein [Alphaproteobacteria bacterium]